MAMTNEPISPVRAQPATREWSELDRLCDQYMLDVAKLDPIAATDWGLPGDQAALPDLSPAGLKELAELQAGLLVKLKTVELVDDVDHVTAAALKDRLGLELELFESGEKYAELNNLASPIQQVRDIFSLMPTETAADWENILGRLRAIPQALEGYKESLALGAEMAVVATKRQVHIGMEQCKKLSHAGGYFAKLVGTCPLDVAAEVGGRDLHRAATEAAHAYHSLGMWLRSNLLRQAPSEDGVGEKRYKLFSAMFVGAKVDLDETYQWGLEELARIKDAQRQIAEQLYGPGTTVRECFNRLEADPARQVRGKPALKKWLQDTADQAIAELNGTQFDIAPPLQTIECMIAPSDEGGIWYTAPSADFSRPGRMWWSVPKGDDVFHVWQERTTVFHEGVPGHHLQLGQAIYQAETLNLWRRLGSWFSGYGEGWALYAEQLMADLGYQSDPADMLGMLDGQRLRAARVVLDIGVHLEKKRPDGQGTWDADYAWTFLRENVTGSDAMLRFELDRYLGWPGQAPSYKIGQRLWEQLAQEYRKKHGDSPEVMRQFHSRALNLGALPMKTLFDVVLS